MKYMTEAFDEWWFTTQFDRAYWQVNSQKHQTEYKWAKLAWDAARRDLLEAVEKLNIENAKLAEQINYYHLAFRGRHELSLAAWAQKTIHELQDQLQAAQALAAQHLADQELLVMRERKRVARECAKIIEQHLKSIGKVKDPYELGAKMACVTIRDVIRTRYGVEEP